MLAIVTTTVVLAPLPGDPKWGDTRHAWKSRVQRHGRYGTLSIRAGAVATSARGLTGGWLIVWRGHIFVIPFQVIDAARPNLLLLDVIALGLIE